MIFYVEALGCEGGRRSLSFRTTFLWTSVGQLGRKNNFIFYVMLDLQFCHPSYFVYLVDGFRLQMFESCGTGKMGQKTEGGRNEIKTRKRSGRGGLEVAYSTMFKHS